MPKTGRAKVVMMVDVYRWGQSSDSAPAFTITLEQANWWCTIGAARLGEPPGRSYRKRKAGKSVLILSQPTSDRLQLRSSTGASLTWQCLMASLAGHTADTSEAMARAKSFAPANMPVSVLAGWITPDVVFAS